MNLFSYVELVMQLRANCPSFGRRIAAVSELAEYVLTQTDVALPWAMAVPVVAVGEAIDAGKGIQVRREVVGIVVCLDNTNQKAQAGGAHTTSVVDTVRMLLEEVELALLAWTPTLFRLKEVPQFLQKTTLAMSPERLWVQLDYEFTFTVTDPLLLDPNLRDECARHIAPANIEKLSIHYGLHQEGEEQVSWDDGWGAPATLPENDPTQEDKDAFDAVSTVIHVPEEVAVESSDFLAPGNPLTNHGTESRYADEE